MDSGQFFILQLLQVFAYLMVPVSNPKIANILMISAWLLWSLDAVFIRLIGDDVSRPLIAGLSCFIGGASLLLPTLRGLKADIRNRKYALLMGIYVVFCTICAEISFAYAVKNLNPGIVSLILRSQIVLTILGAWWWFHEKPDAVIWTGLAIIIGGYACGAYVTLSAPSALESRSIPMGVLFSIAACVLWSLATVIGKKLLEKFTPLELSGTRMFLAGTLILSVLFCTQGGSAFAELTGRQWGLLLAKGGVCSALSFSLYFMGLKYSSLTVATAIEQASPLFTLLIASCILHETISLTQWCIVLFVILGAALIVFYQNRQAEIRKQNEEG